MPISPDGQTYPMAPHQVNVPVPNGSGFQIMVLIQSDGTPDTGEAMDAALMDLVDYFQEWPGRDPGQNVSGQKPVYTVYAATPTNPIPLPDPPEDPPLAP